jgi:hypothetical protein
MICLCLGSRKQEKMDGSHFLSVIRQQFGLALDVIWILDQKKETTKT